MTDQTIPADEVRKIIAAHRDGASGKGGLILAALKDLLPAPPRPTLADMTDEERGACRWLQADTESWGRVVILNPYAIGGNVTLVDDRGAAFPENHARVTPRPDLPRLEWPGDKKPAPAPALPEGWRLADHKGYGRGIVTTENPDDDGHVYFVLHADGLLGYECLSCDHAELTYLDQGADQ